MNYTYYYFIKDKITSNHILLYDFIMVNGYHQNHWQCSGKKLADQIIFLPHLG